MTLFRKIVLSLFIVITTAIILLQFDDELSDEAQALLPVINENDSSQAYLYLLGLGAELDKDPITEGEKVLASIRRLETHYPTIESFDDIDIEVYEPSLSIPDHDIFCPIEEKSCIDTLLNSHDVDLTTPLWSALKERYQTFLTLRDFRSLTQPHIYEPLPRYSYLEAVS